MKEKVEKKNINLTIGELKIEQTKAAKELGKIYEESKKIRKETLNILIRKQNTIEKWKSNLDTIKQNIDTIRRSQNNELLRHLKTIKSLEKEKKERVRDRKSVV